MVCEGGGDVVGVVTPLVGGVAQAFHDDQVVEPRVQLGVQEVEGKDREEQVEVEKERRVKEVRPWISPWMRNDKTQDLSQMRCETTSPGVQECAQCASSAYDVHHASVCVNVVVGVLVVLCELHVIVLAHVIPLCDDAVVGLTLRLIAHVIVVVFVVAILRRIFCIWRYTLYIVCGRVKHPLLGPEPLPLLAPPPSEATASTSR